MESKTIKIFGSPGTGKTTTLLKLLEEKISELGDSVLSEVENSCEDCESIGYNIKTGKFEDFLESGIIDPTKVTRCALENAASIAGTVLLTECTVVNKPEEKKEEVGAMPGMF